MIGMTGAGFEITMDKVALTKQNLFEEMFSKNMLYE